MSNGQNRNFKVFVYGTLKQGYGNHRLLKDAIFEGIGKTKGRLIGVVGTNFPYAVLTDSNSSKDGEIYGEIYSVNQKTMDALDMLEGCRTPQFSEANFYSRKLVPVLDGTGSITMCWIYYISDRRFDDMKSHHKSDLYDIKNGDWKLEISK